MIRPIAADDVAEVKAWHTARGLEYPPPSLWPEIAFIEPGVGVGFLLVCGRIALIDGLISNPAVSGFRAGKALRGVIDALEEKALQSGAVRIVCLTQRRSVLRTARKRGFRLLGSFALLAKGP